MSGAAWVAGSVRARLLARHRLGTDGARALAAAGSLEVASMMLSGSAYGGSTRAGGSAAMVEYAIWSPVVWDLRVLAGWLPGAGVDVMRVFAGFFEIENIEGRLSFLADGNERSAFELGGLATVWTRARSAMSVGELREQLRRSQWGDPGSEDPMQILTYLRLAWALRLSDIAGGAAWGAGAAALVLARSLLEGEERVPDDVGRRAPALGRRALGASSLAELAVALPDSARWVMEGIDEPEALWRAEAAWWRRLDRDGARLSRRAQAGPGIVIGAVARRMADAWRACAAVEIATRGTSAQGLVDVFE